MALTAITEFGPQQWVGLILSKSGAQPMLILALVTGLMAVARYFGGDAVGKFSQTGVLLGSAILATVGVYLFSTQTGLMAYVAAIVYALGIAYFWPNMIGFVAEKIPKSGALAASHVVRPRSSLRQRESTAVCRQKLRGLSPRPSIPATTPGSWSLVIGERRF